MVSVKEFSFYQKEDLSLIFKDQYYESVCDLGVQYVAKIILKILIISGSWDLLLKKRFSISELMEKLNYVESRKYAFEWMLRFLANNDYLETLNEGNVNVFKPKSQNISIDIDELRSKILSIDKNLLVSCKYMEFISEYYVDFFQGKINGYEILFTKDKMRLWNEYFSNGNSGYVVYNQLGALGVKNWIANINKDANFLEIGSGTGNASLLILDDLEKSGLSANIKSYVLSDISSMFLRLGKRNVSDNYFGRVPIGTKKLDFNTALADQDILPEDVHVIYGVNALHAAKNLFFSLKELYKILSPGGMLIISECIRDRDSATLVQEIIFNLLDSYTNVEIDGKYRKSLGFLTLDEWVNIFTAVGFVDIEYILNCSVESRGDEKRLAHAMVLKGVKK